jgi:cardiolipin synthase
MFIEDHLRQLRSDRFSLTAIHRYGRELARHIRAEWDANPGAVRSVWSVALGFFAAAFAASAVLSLTVNRPLGLDFFLFTAIGMLPAFAAVSFSIGLLRDRHGYRLSSLNLPLALTLLRLALLPGIVLFILEREFALALGAYLLAAVSDVVDGWLARVWDQCTPLGKVLDPVIDIALNLAVFSALFAAGLLPAWVFTFAALRYGLLLVGGACLYLFVGPLRIEPTLFGRLTGVVMSTLVGLLALLHVVRGAWVERLATLTELALGLLMAATVGHVIVLGWHNLRLMTGKVEAAGRVVGDVRWGGR